ncbi:MAG: FxsA family protein [Mariniblastus sp.]
MLGKLIFLFIVVPLADLALLVWMSSYTGLAFSISIVVISGIIGAVLAKRSVNSVFAKIKRNFASGQISPDLLTDGAMILFAAGLLLTPGFLTDAFGLSILIPHTRRWYRSILAKWFKQSVNFQYVQMPMHGDENTVDGDVVKKTDPNDTEEPRRIKSGELLP